MRTFARLLRAAELTDASRRRAGARRRGRDARPALDLVDWNFTTSKPDGCGWRISRSCTRRRGPVSGGSSARLEPRDLWPVRGEPPPTGLVLDALEIAIGLHRPGNVIHHLDQGSQYTSLAFENRCRKADVRPSTCSAGGAPATHIRVWRRRFRTWRCRERRRFSSDADAKMACFSFIEGWYNPVRLRFVLGYKSPMDYAEAMWEASMVS